MSPHYPFARSHDTQDQRLQGDRNVAQDLDNIFRLTAAQPVAESHAQVPSGKSVAGNDANTRPVTRADLDAALDMLSRAAKAMDLMQSRYQHVEDYAKGVAERAEKDVAVAFAQAREWEVRAAGGEGKLNEFRNRAIEAERRAEAAERGAKEARDWLESLYNKIVTSFDTRALLKSQAA